MWHFVLNDFCKILFGAGNVNNIRTQANPMWQEFYVRKFLLFTVRHLGLKHKFRIWTSERNYEGKFMCMTVVSEWWCWMYLILPDGTTHNKVKVLHILPQWLKIYQPISTPPPNLETYSSTFREGQHLFLKQEFTRGRRQMFFILSGNFSSQITKAFSALYYKGFINIIFECV